MLNVIQRNIPNSFRGSRRLRHILLSVKKKVPSVDYADPKYFDKQADELDISGLVTCFHFPVLYLFQHPVMSTKFVVFGTK
jgi:hypothetical protein